MAANKGRYQVLREGETKVRALIVSALERCLLPFGYQTCPLEYGIDDTAYAYIGPGSAFERAHEKLAREMDAAFEQQEREREAEQPEEQQPALQPQQ
jgi:hypothetical protein